MAVIFFLDKGCQSGKIKMLMGTVYLIHFECPYQHARHYLGFTDDLPACLDRHLDGNGGRLLRVFRDAGISYRVVRTWEGDRALERKLKRRKGSSRLCPICREEKRLKGRRMNGPFNTGRQSLARSQGKHNLLRDHDSAPPLTGRYRPEGGGRPNPPSGPKGKMGITCHCSLSGCTGAARPA